MAIQRVGRDTALYKRLRDRFRRQCAREDARCWLCWQRIDYSLPGDHPAGFSLDHMLPVSKFPELAEEPSNFRPSHLECNVQRGNRDPGLAMGQPSRRW